MNSLIKRFLIGFTCVFFFPHYSIRFSTMRMASVHFQYFFTCLRPFFFNSQHRTLFFPFLQFLFRSFFFFYSALRRLARPNNVKNQFSARKQRMAVSNHSREDGPKVFISQPLVVLQLVDYVSFERKHIQNIGHQAPLMFGTYLRPKITSFFWASKMIAVL